MDSKLATGELSDILYRPDRSFVVVQPILFDIIIQNRPIFQCQPELLIVYDRKVRIRTFYIIQQFEYFGDCIFVISRQKLFQNSRNMSATLF